MADLDLTALRVRLAELEGFDPTGRLVFLGEPDDDESPRGICTGIDLDGALWAAVASHSCGWDARDECWISAVDSDTRDRLARYCVTRQYDLFGLRDEDLVTAPFFGYAGSESVPTWVLASPGRTQVWSARFGRGIDETLATLAGIPHTPGPAEWGALVAVARHLGGSRG